MKHSYEKMKTEICLFDEADDIIAASGTGSSGTESTGSTGQELEGEIMPFP